MNKELLHFVAFDQHLAPIHLVLSQIVRDVLELLIEMTKSCLSQHVNHLFRYLLLVNLVEVHEVAFEFVKLMKRGVVLVEFEFTILDSIRRNRQFLLLVLA